MAQCMRSGFRKFTPGFQEKVLVGTVREKMSDEVVSRMTLRAANERKTREKYDSSDVQKESAKKRRKSKHKELNDTPGGEDEDWNVPTGYYIVQDIVAHKRVPNARNVVGLAKFEYQVRWEGYPAANNSWVPYENIQHLSALQTYITDHPDLQQALRKREQDGGLADSEEEDVLELKVSKLLAFVRNRRTSRMNHCDEDECFQISFQRCFFSEFARKLQWFHHTGSHKYEIDFNIWCPERTFDAFLEKCISWAKSDQDENREGEFSKELLNESGTMLLNERAAVVKFGIAAPSIPFHVLGRVDESEVPWRQSVKPCIY